MHGPRFRCNLLFWRGFHCYAFLWAGEGGRGGGGDWDVGGRGKSAQGVVEDITVFGVCGVRKKG